MYEKALHPGGPTADALFDLVGGFLQPEAARWIEEHCAGCLECGRVLARIRVLEDAIDPAGPSGQEISPWAPTVEALARRVEARHRRRRRRSFLTLAACASAASLAFAVWMGEWRAPSLTAATSEPASSERASAPISCLVESREGSADLSPHPGAPRATIGANLEIPENGSVALRPRARLVLRWGGSRVVVSGGRLGAQVRLESSRASDRRLRLDQGAVSLDVDPLPEGARLAVVTADTTVTVRGTRFRVTRTREGTSVAVARGHVGVVSTQGSFDLRSGHGLAPLAAQAEPLSPEEERELAEMDTLESGEHETETLDVFADSAGAQVSLDGRVRGVAPVSLLVSPGPHLLRVSASQRLPVEEEIEVVAGVPLVFRAEFHRIDPSFATSHSLRRARELVLAGKYKNAVQTLETLRRSPSGALSTRDRDRAAILEAQALRFLREPERAIELLLAVARGGASEAEQGLYLAAQTLARDLKSARRAAPRWAESLRRFPNGVFREEASFRLGETLLGSRDDASGVAALERYLFAFPSGDHTDDAHMLIAIVRRDRMGDCPGALGHFQAVEQAGGPQAESALVGEARCHARTGRLGEARAAYQRYLAEHPRGRYADEARRLGSP